LINENKKAVLSQENSTMQRVLAYTQWLFRRVHTARYESDATRHWPRYAPLGYAPLAARRVQ